MSTTIVKTIQEDYLVFETKIEENMSATELFDFIQTEISIKHYGFRLAKNLNEINHKDWAKKNIGNYSFLFCGRLIEFTEEPAMASASDAGRGRGFISSYRHHFKKGEKIRVPLIRDSD